jgi:hypothetical protein
MRVRVQADADDPAFREELRRLGPGAKPRHVIASEIISNLESVAYVRWVRIDNFPASPRSCSRTKI